MKVSSALVLTLLVLVVACPELTVLGAPSPPPQHREPLEDTQPWRGGVNPLIEPEAPIHTDSTPVSTFKVNLNIVNPNNEPADEIYVYIFSCQLSLNSYAYMDGGYTDSSGAVSFLLPRGRYIAVIHNWWNQPKYLAIYRFYLRVNSTFDVYVADLTYPVILEAIKPLEGRPFTTDSYFYVGIPSSPDLWEYSFWEDSAGYLQVFLPRNRKYSLEYRDNGARYVLFLKNVQVKKANIVVRFDASKTGLVQPIFTVPSSGFAFNLSYLVIVDQLDYWVDIPIGTGNLWAVTAGSYEAYARGWYDQTDGDYMYSYYYRYNLGRLNVRSKKTNTVSFGGDLVGSMKPNRASYKAGETVMIDYWFNDAFKHMLGSTSIDIYERVDDEWEWIDGYYMPIYMNIADSEGLIESQDLTGYSPSDTIYLYTPSFTEPGIYTVEIVFDTGPYQGIVTVSTTIKIK